MMDRWLRDLVAGLDAYTDEPTRRAILGECGRGCIPPDLVERARCLRRAHQDLSAWLDALNAEHIAGGHLAVAGGDIVGRYERCYCGIAKGGGDGLSPTFCLCSRGWLERLFQGALERPVRVEMLQTVVGGAPDCRFRIGLD
jgi:hypothetical protein